MVQQFLQRWVRLDEREFPEAKNSPLKVFILPWQWWKHYELLLTVIWEIFNCRCVQVHGADLHNIIMLTTFTAHPEKRGRHRLSVGHKSPLWREFSKVKAWPCKSCHCQWLDELKDTVIRNATTCYYLPRLFLCLLYNRGVCPSSLSSQGICQGYSVQQWNSESSRTTAYY